MTNSSLRYHIHDNGWTVILDNFDFAKATQDDVNELAWLLATNTLVVATNQSHLTIDDQLRVVHMFGDVEDLAHFGDIPPYNTFVLPRSQGKISRVTGELDEHGEPGLFGHVSDLDWHCNQPGIPSRKPLVWLFGIKGTAGSRTSWTNNILAYNDLSNEWKEKIKDLKLICGWKKDSYSEYDFGRAKAGITEDFNEHYNPSLVHTNNGGKTGLFFPFLQFRNFVGLSEEESIAIVEPLRDHVLQEKYIYHHDWQDGDVVISEQWLGIHKRWEFDGMPNRILHRITFDYENSNIVAKDITE
jgi:alpha-ketoglutarate-dependent taurine dioxygenase